MHFFPVRAITLDLDDTVWPIAPAIDRAEDALDAWLQRHAPRAAARWPLAALSNGNACLRTIGLMHLFRFQLGAGDHGAGKPDPGIFHAACARLGHDPGVVLHVGDDVRTDIEGAQRAGLRTAWINREGATWPRRMPPPDLEFTTLTALADWLDAARHPESMSA